MKKRYLALGLIISIVVAFNASVFYMDLELEKRGSKGVYNNCKKIWSARGLYNNHAEQNTLTSMKRAFDVGTLGIEVDLFYDVKMHKFIISHGKPQKGENGDNIYDLKEGKILTLEILFNTLGKDHYFWLDYKNLGRINKEETLEAITRLNEISKDNDMKSRLYLEGSRPFSLLRYTKAGFNTIFGIHPLPDKNIFSSILLKGYKLAYFFSNFTAIALPYGTLEKPIFINDTQQSLENIPSFIFHVPDNKDLLSHLVKTNDVRVILAGRDISVNRVDIHNCEQ